jgi:hypothetical protein
MNTARLAYLLPASCERWLRLLEERESSKSVPPEPPVPSGREKEPEGPNRQYPFWTYFIENPHPRTGDEENQELKAK